MSEKTYDIAIIGSGPAGYTSALYQQPTPEGGPSDDVLHGVLQQPIAVAFSAPRPPAVTPTEAATQQTMNAPTTRTGSKLVI